MPRTAAAQPVLDIVGAGSAILCAVHCAATGLFVAVLPVVGFGSLMNERTELFFLASAIGLGALSLGLSWRMHHHTGALWLLTIGLVSLLVLRPMFEEGSALEFATVLMGASLLVMAHWKNHRLMRASALPSYDIVAMGSGLSTAPSRNDAPIPPST